MPGQQIQLTEWARQLADLVVLASCAAMASPSRRKGSKTEGDAVPVVEGEKQSQRKRDSPSPEVIEFMGYPLHFQRQMLEYGRTYIAANFEAKNGENP